MRWFQTVKTKSNALLAKLLSPRQKKLVLACLAYILVIGALGLVIALTGTAQVKQGEQLIVPVEKATPTSSASRNVSEQINAINQSERYIANFDRDTDLPLIGIIVTGLGLEEGPTKKAILDLPPFMTLAVSPYSTDATFWVEQSIKSRHETLLEIPMQPDDFPNSDPGYLALMHNIDYKTNSDRLDEISSKGEAYIGFINVMGNTYLKDVDNLRGLYAWIRSQNTLFVEQIIEPKAIAKRKDFRGDQYIQTYTSIDETATPDAIVANLRKLEKQAINNGYAIGTATNYPVTLAVLKQWSNTLNERGVILAPISAIMEKRNALRRE